MNENRIRSVFTDSDIEFPDSYRSLTFPSSPERPDPKEGRTFYNSTNKALESFQNGQWVSLSGIVPASVDLPQAPLSEVLEAGSNVRLETRPDGRVRVHVDQVGDYTTVENIGVGSGTLYRGKTGTNLNLRRLRSTNDHLKIETDGDTVAFTMTDPGETNAGRNLGDGLPLYAGKNGPELLFRSLIGSDTVRLTQLANGNIRFDAILPVLPAVTPEVTPVAAPEVPRKLIGQSGLEIDLDAGTIVSGFQGTIDGFRFPEIATTVTGIRQLDPGILMKTDLGFQSIKIGGTPEQVAVVSSGIDILLKLSDDIVLPGTKSVLLPSGPDETRDDRIGAIRYNSAGRFEGRHPSGWEQFASTDNGTFTTLRVDGDAHISGRLNGRDPAADAVLLEGLASTRGLIGNFGTDGLGSVRIMTDASRPGISISDSGSTISIGIDAKAIIDPILAQIDASLVRSDTVVANRTIDGRNLIRDGALIDSLTQLGAGLMISTGNGKFVSRMILASAMPNAVGLSVDSSDGSGDIRVGLRLDELPEVTTLGDTDWIIISTANGNAKISMANFKNALAGMKEPA